MAKFAGRVDLTMIGHFLGEQTMAIEIFGYCWFGVWDERGAYEVTQIKGALPESFRGKFAQLSNANPDHILILRKSMVSLEKVEVVDFVQWSMRSDGKGKTDSNFIAMRPVAGPLEDAEKWIDSDDGKIWRAGATAYQLISVKTTVAGDETK